MPHSTRRRIALGLRKLRDKQLENPWKKHDNIPALSNLLGAPVSDGDATASQIFLMKSYKQITSGVLIPLAEVRENPLMSWSSTFDET